MRGGWTQERGVSCSGPMNRPAHEPTIYDVITDDHREVASLLDRLIAEDDLARRERLFVELRQALDLHTRAEETVFHDLLAEEENCVPMIQRARRDHHTLRRVLSELDRMDVDDERWHELLGQLVREVESHVEVDEDELFTAARELIDDDQARRVAVTFSAVKSRFEGELEVAA